MWQFGFINWVDHVNCPPQSDSKEIHIINPVLVDKTKLSCYTSHRRSTTVSLETYPSIYLYKYAANCKSVSYARNISTAYMAK